MNLPNKITLSRMILIPIMVIVILIKPLTEVENIIFGLNLGQLLFAILFVIASFTDFLDGHIARKNNQVTTFGKFLDPIADKLLVVTAMMYLVNINRIIWWMVVIVIAREFIVTTIRLLAVEGGKVIAASVYGKLKMIATVIALTVLLFNDFGLHHLVGDILFYVAVFLTLMSGIDYFWKNRQLVFESI